MGQECGLGMNRFDKKLSPLRGTALRVLLPGPHLDKEDIPEAAPGSSCYSPDSMQD